MNMMHYAYDKILVLILGSNHEENVLTYSQKNSIPVFIRIEPPLYVDLNPPPPLQPFSVQAGCYFC